MPALIDRRDLHFLLYELLGIDELQRLERFSGHDRRLYDETIDTALRLAAEQFEPHAALLDANEPRFDGERVHLIPEVGVAIRTYIDAGFLAAPFAVEDGGLGLPYTLTCATSAVFTAANIGSMGYMFLTGAAANLVRTHGSPEQVERYFRPMVEGRFFGTMALSEPQAGSSLGDIRTRAIPQPDGSYHLVGNKMWISGAEHDLSENIINLVLARIDGAPAGTKGISLFIVPKYRLRADGSAGERNGVFVAGLNHKMGYRGITNCALNFGERVPAVGELMGKPHHGLTYMFHMMNEARVGVGMNAAAMGSAGFRYSLDYAKTRLQGRHADNKNPQAAQVPIIEHADVRRMLLAQKAYVEGALALTLYCARLVDEMSALEGEAREARRLMLELLTPIAKAWPSDWCLEANKLAIQVLGGYGYTRDYPVERYYRDNRLNPIHEGTNGIQALDLLGRKLTLAGGSVLRELFEAVQATADAAGPELNEFANGLRQASQRVQTTVERLLACLRQDPNLALANASVFLDLFGHWVIGWMWLRQATLAQRALAAASGEDKAFYQGKVFACQYFFRHELPKLHAWSELLCALDDTTLRLPIEAL
jgi:butyryl-CoA dehydrogenase